MKTDIEWLTETLVAATVGAAQALAPLDPRKQPAQYHEARAALLSACRVLVGTLDGTPVQATGAAQRELPHGSQVNRDTAASAELAALAAQFAEGVDPHKDLFGRDPRAEAPRCVHGLPFTEPCEPCALVDVANLPPLPPV